LEMDAEFVQGQVHGKQEKFNFLKS
jgi:hypothetical protein